MPGSTALRLWILTAALVTLALAIYLAGPSRYERLTVGQEVPWIALAAAFAAVGVFVVHIPSGKGAHTVALAEVPMVLGIVLASPGQLLTAGLVGTAVALAVYRRQPLIKLVFNLALFLVDVDVTVLVFRGLLSGGDALSARGWVSALAGTLLACVLSAPLVRLAMALSGARVDLAALARSMPFPLVVSASNTVVALAGVRLFLTDRVSAVILLGIPALALWVAYRAYHAERRRHARVQVLYETSRAFHGSTDVETVIRVLLRRAHDVFNAATAELTLLPGDSEGVITRYTLDAPDLGRLRAAPCTSDAVGAVAVHRRAQLIPRGRAHDSVAFGLQRRGIRDAMLVGLHGEGGVFGSLLVGNKRSDVDSFSRDDMDLLDAFATQASVSLDNSRLGDELQRLAYQDVLTGLANRSLLIQRLGRALARAREGASGCAVLFIDIDDFKTVNDSLGHLVGDQLLVAVAGRIRSCLRPTDVAARLGGDEFAVLLDAVQFPDDATALAARLVENIRAPFVIDGTRLDVHVSAGVVVSGVNDEETAIVTADEMVSRADVAMYRAKTKGKDRWEIFEPSMQTAVLERHRLQHDLTRAVEEEQFTVHYQPVVTLPEGIVIGVEALVRWRHPIRGLILPDDFISAAEENGLILPIGDFVLRSACNQLAQWQEHTPDLVLMVNISGRQLRDPGFLDRVVAILKETGVRPTSLELEITESIMVVDDPVMRGALRSLRGIGIKLAIDDFGTGYSSLSTLRELPVDVLKIAKPFVDGIDEDSKDLAFATAIVRMAHTLDLAIIAEGVERSGQADRLSGLLCGMAQGWLYSRAVPARELTGLIGRRVGLAPLPNGSLPLDPPLEMPVARW